MHLRTILNKLGGPLLILIASPPLAAQEHPARRLSSIVGVAVEEYEKGIDARGRVTSELEYQEAVDFLRDAREVAERLSGERAAEVRASVDSLIAAVAQKRSPAEIQSLHERFVSALGTEGALELPERALNVAAGRELYARNCASCHGDRGMGDGPAATNMNPPPPPIGDATAMLDASPALLFRVISVGVTGTQMPGWSTTLSAQQRWDIVAYLHSLRVTESAMLEGEGLFLQRCASCHGATGAGDGPASRALTRLPPEIASFAWQVERSDAQLAQAIRDGVPGSAMPPARDLTAEETAKIVAFVRALPVRNREVPTLAAAADSDATTVARRVLSTLDMALTAANGGRRDDASDRAFDAYIAFEPLETPARAKNPGLVASMEQHFAEFKAAVRAGDVRAAERSREAIEAGLPAVVDLTRTPSSPLAAFFQSLLIILREGLEAILVVGAVVAFLLKTGNRHRLRAIWAGVALGLAASAVTAVVLQTVLRAMPATREIIEGATMLVAVVVLFSVSYWLISKVEAAKWQQFIREKVSAALEHGGGRALAFVAFLAVYREGAETALFYQALFIEGTNVMLPIVLGILVGAVVLAIVFTLFYRYGVRIPLRPFFGATSALLYYMAFVFMGKGIRELQEGNAVSITRIPGFPTIEAVGIYPTVETLLAQLLLVLLFLFALAKTFWPKRAVALPTVPAAGTPAAQLSARIAELREAAARLDKRITALEHGMGEGAAFSASDREGSSNT